MSKEESYRTRLARHRAPSVAGAESTGAGTDETAAENSVVDCGWGRLIFAHTFQDNRELADALLAESAGRRDIAFYVKDPHVLLALEPQQLFLDPSHTFRLWLDRYKVSPLRPRGYTVRLLNRRGDAEAVHRVYLSRNMIPPPIEFMWDERASRAIQIFVAADTHSGEILGAATGVDHVEAFGDPEQGASLWALAVDPQARLPGIGQALVRHMAEKG
ncbi:MAG: GNAT family N-acetyltransferase [Sedimenticolaceae bacterium]